MDAPAGPIIIRNKAKQVLQLYRQQPHVVLQLCVPPGEHRSGGYDLNEEEQEMIFVGLFALATPRTQANMLARMFTQADAATQARILDVLFSTEAALNMDVHELVRRWDAKADEVLTGCPLLPQAEPGAQTTD